MGEVAEDEMSLLSDDAVEERQGRRMSVLILQDSVEASAAGLGWPVI